MSKTNTETELKNIYMPIYEKLIIRFRNIPIFKENGEESPGTALQFLKDNVNALFPDGDFKEFLEFCEKASDDDVRARIKNEGYSKERPPSALKDNTLDEMLALISSSCTIDLDANQVDTGEYLLVPEPWLKSDNSSPFKSGNTFFNSVKAESDKPQQEIQKDNEIGKKMT
jgi:hypothetical protein